MKEAFVDLKQVFPDMPPACDQALMTAVHSVSEKQRAFGIRHARRIAILSAALLAIVCIASAAFYPQIISWFESHYGEEYTAWMEKGSVAAADMSVENNGAVFTVDEVLTQGRGLYVMGTIKAADGYILVESDCTADEPFGYNIHYGETAPDGTPSIAEKAKETGKTLRYVSCHLEEIGVDGGKMLAPGCWGYDARIQRDGSIVFTMTVEDGTAVEPGTSYTLAFSTYSYGANSDGTRNYDDSSEKAWQITVTPSPVEQK